MTCYRILVIIIIIIVIMMMMMTMIVVKIVITIMIVITTTITTVKFPKIFNSHTEPFLCPSNLFGRQRFYYFLGYGFNWFMGQIT